MVGRHRKPKSPWPRRIIAVGVLGGAFWAGSSIGGYHGPDPRPDVAVQQAYVSVAQKFALAVHAQLCGKPSLPQMLCAQAIEVAAHPIHDGRDGKDGKNGIDGEDGSPGRDGRNGRDGRSGSPAREEIFQFPDSIYACPRSGGSDIAPIFKCSLVKPAAPPATSTPSN